MIQSSDLPDTRPKATILIVDDEISNIEIMNEALGDEYEICFATSGEQALEQMHVTMPDLVLLDVVMQGMQGFEVCEKLKQDPLLADVPVIFITGLNDTDDEVRGLSIGAIDYVTKPIHPLILRNRVRNHIELKQLRDHLTEMAVTDALTGLHNRRKLDSLLKKNVQDLLPDEGWLSLIMLDLDFFKQYNDAYGHMSGDNCLKMVGAALNRAVVRVAGHSARYGGEEFCCILPNCPPGQAGAVAVEIRYQLQQMRIPHERSDVSPYVTISIGVASARVRAGMTPSDWVRFADAQLSLAKAEGRDRVKREIFGQEFGEAQP
ncbi:diguanylate cyclase [Pseudogemmobacter faecipullorum]|uniref:diguanylate cyclase n=1 Tax=Pseudogemmobacter faecipullorum TaxID=2755041 RepID=UPI001D0064D4